MYESNHVWHKLGYRFLKEEKTTARTNQLKTGKNRPSRYKIEARTHGGTKISPSKTAPGINQSHVCLIKLLFPFFCKEMFVYILIFYLTCSWYFHSLWNFYGCELQSSMPVHPTPLPSHGTLSCSSQWHLGVYLVSIMLNCWCKYKCKNIKHI